MDIKLNKLAEEIHQINVDNGFWPTSKDERNKSELLMLIVSELAEAMEALRDNNFCKYSLSKDSLDLSEGEFEEIYKKYKTLSTEDFKMYFEDTIKNTFEDEIADSIIRLLDLCAGLNIDIEKHIEMKVAYNKTRGIRHGKLF